MFSPIVCVAVQFGGHVFLVFSTAYASLCKEVDNSYDVRQNSCGVVGGQTKEVTASSSDIVWLTGMGGS